MQKLQKENVLDGLMMPAKNMPKIHQSKRPEI